MCDYFYTGAKPASLSAVTTTAVEYALSPVISNFGRSEIAGFFRF